MNIDLSEKYDLAAYEVQDLESFQERVFSKLYKNLDDLGFDRRRYILGKKDAGANGELCLHHDNGLWAVYASERGERLNPAFFASAWNAARYLMWELMRTSNREFPGFPTVIADIF
jgi:hypothetical protein